MKRILMLCVCTMMTTALIWAQDIIVTRDAQKIEAKIIEVLKSEIKYKEKGNLDGPTFVLETNKISSVIYANGKVVLYDKPAESPQTETTTQPAPNIDESTAEIRLLSGEIITAQIASLGKDIIAYTIDGQYSTVATSSVETVTFLKNGQVKTYNSHQTSVSTYSSSTPTSSSAKATPMVDKHIYRDNGEYRYNNTYISSKEVALILEKDNSAAYSEWQKANRMLVSGAVLTGVGGGLAIGGLCALIIQQPLACIITDCIALVPLGIGLGLTLGSSAHYNNAIDIYNAKYDHAAMQLKWYVAPNEVGLAFAF